MHQNVKVIILILGLVGLIVLFLDDLKVFDKDFTNDYPILSTILGTLGGLVAFGPIIDGLRTIFSKEKGDKDK